MENGFLAFVGMLNLSWNVFFTLILQILTTWWTYLDSLPMPILHYVFWSVAILHQDTYLGCCTLVSLEKTNANAKAHHLHCDECTKCHQHNTRCIQSTELCSLDKFLVLAINQGQPYMANTPWIPCYLQGRFWRQPLQTSTIQSSDYDCCRFGVFTKLRTWYGPQLFWNRCLHIHVQDQNNLTVSLDTTTGRKVQAKVQKMIRL